jgi:hypothetical protein
MMAGMNREHLVQARCVVAVPTRMVHVVPRALFSMLRIKKNRESRFNMLDSRLYGMFIERHQHLKGVSHGRMKIRTLNRCPNCLIDAARVPAQCWPNTKLPK